MGRIGTLIVLLKPIYEVISFLGNLNFVIGNMGPVLRFADSVWGTFSLAVVGFFLIYRASQENVPGKSVEAGYKSRSGPEIELLRAENKQLRIEKSRLEENDRLKVGLLATKPTSPTVKMPNVGPSTYLDVKPLETTKPTGLLFFVGETQRLRKENEKVKAERDALKDKVEQVGSQEYDDWSDEDIK
ncbi:hypothetical protein BH23ACT11_BH23ACT11_18160 [soil metagenome]